MAAPQQITLNKLNDTIWQTNKALSGDYNPMLRLQGMKAAERKLCNKLALTMSIKQWTEEDQTRMRVKSSIGKGKAIPPTEESFVLDFEPRSNDTPFFGRCVDRVRFARIDELEDDFLRQGWEHGTTEVLLIHTEHLKNGSESMQACGFEMVGDQRRHTRRIVVKQGQLVLRLRGVFDYKGLSSCSDERDMC